MKKMYLFVLLLLLLPFSVSYAVDIDVDDDTNDAVDIDSGGTNAVTAAAARANLGILGYTVLDDSDIAGDAITAAQAVIGTMVTNDGKGALADYDLPACSAGLVVEVFAEEANTIVLDSVGDDIIHFIDGSTVTAADAIDSDGNISSSIKMICHDATNWWVKSQVGVWVDGGTN